MDLRPQPHSTGSSGLAEQAITRTRHDLSHILAVVTLRLTQVFLLARGL